MANQIAAGEVVERPASVVKELLENAIDAHSQQIHVEIERGGSALVRVTDDGSGINKDDLSLAVTRHATSKIHSLKELEQIVSLGFRGEALASISAVSKLVIKSKQAEQQAWQIDTGTDSDFANYNAEPEPVAQPQGTTIEVRDLFFNTPARRKFMRTIKTEFKHIDDIVKRIALSQFDIAFKLTHNKKLVRNLPVAVTEKAIIQRIGKLFSPDFIEHANKVDFSADHFSNMGSLRLWGWVSAPQWHKKQADWQYFYVNGRYIKDKLVNHALRQAYQELLPEDTFSAYILYLEIDPQQVDVNVHPTKHEVRFRQSRLVHDFIYSALKQALFPEPLNPQAQTDLLITKSQSDTALKSVPSKDVSSEYEHAKAYVNPYSQGGQYQQKQYPAKQYQPSTQSSINEHQVAEQLSGLQQLYQQNDVANTGNKTPLDRAKKANCLGTSLGALIENYLLSQHINSAGQAEIYIVHIGRAQQYLWQQLFTAEQATPLLIPETITLKNTAIEVLLAHQKALKYLGIELGQLADDTLMIRSLPALYGIPGCQINLELLFQALLKEIKNSSNNDEEKYQDCLIQSLEVQALSLNEQNDLLKLLAEYSSKNDAERILFKQQAIWTTLDQTKLKHLF